MPEVGEIKRGKELGKENPKKASHKFQWVLCPKCHNGRWVDMSTFRRHNFTGLCIHCVAKDNVEKGRIIRAKGADNPKWKGGRTISPLGYVQISAPNHPNKSSRGYVFEHRLVVEKSLGRYLTSEEIVHHLNGRKTDNRLENLAVVSRHNHDKLTIRKLTQKRIRHLEAQLSQQKMYIDLFKLGG